MIKDGKLRCIECGSDRVDSQPAEKRATDGAVEEIATRVICNDCDRVFSV